MKLRGVGATCRGTWAHSLFPFTESLDAQITFPSTSRSPSWWAHSPPRAHLHGVSHALRNTLSALRQTEKKFWQERRKTGPEGQKELSRRTFQDLLGLCWYPTWFCYKLQRGVCGCFRGIVSYERGGKGLAENYMKMCLIFFLCLWLFNFYVTSL